MKTLYVDNGDDWRAWLEKNYNREKEIWLIYPRKSTGKPRIVYNDAVEEALCFGWIDSNLKGIDKEYTAQRFSPRNPKSSYSQANKERLRRLVKEGRVVPSVLKTLGNMLSEKFTFPTDILKELKTNGQAWNNFKQFSPAYKRIRIAYIDAARKRPDEFKKRLNYFIKMTEKNKQFGFGGIEKYY